MMNKTDRCPSLSFKAIERGEVYDHETYGRVEVTGIWHGSQWVDTAPPLNDHEVGDQPIIIRYTPGNGGWDDELAATRDEFLDAVEPTN